MGRQSRVGWWLLGVTSVVTAGLFVPTPDGVTLLRATGAVETMVHDSRIFDPALKVAFEPSRYSAASIIRHSLAFDAARDPDPANPNDPARLLALEAHEASALHAINLADYCVVRASAQALHAALTPPQLLLAAVRDDMLAWKFILLHETAHCYWNPGLAIESAADAATRRAEMRKTAKAMGEAYADAYALLALQRHDPEAARLLAASLTRWRQLSTRKGMPHRAGAFLDAPALTQPDPSAPAATGFAQLRETAVTAALAAAVKWAVEQGTSADDAAADINEIAAQSGLPLRVEIGMGAPAVTAQGIPHVRNTARSMAWQLPQVRPGQMALQAFSASFTIPDVPPDEPRPLRRLPKAVQAEASLGTPVVFPAILATDKPAQLNVTLSVTEPDFIEGSGRLVLHYANGMRRVVVAKQEKSRLPGDPKSQRAELRFVTTLGAGREQLAWVSVEALFRGEETPRSSKRAPIRFSKTVRSGHPYAQVHADRIDFVRDDGTSAHSIALRTGAIERDEQVERSRSLLQETALTSPDLSHVMIHTARKSLHGAEDEVTVRVADATKTKWETRLPKGSSAYLPSVAFSADASRSLVVYQSGDHLGYELMVLDDAGQAAYLKTGIHHAPRDMQISASGRFVAWLGDDAVRVIDTDTNKTWEQALDSRAGAVQLQELPGQGFAVLRDGQPLAMCPICKDTQRTKLFDAEETIEPTKPLKKKPKAKTGRAGTPAAAAPAHTAPPARPAPTAPRPSRYSHI